MPNLLIVDDEPLSRISIRTLGDWESQGYRIIGEASNGIEALEWLDESIDIDIVLADVNMPKMNGIELLNEIRARYPDLIVLMLSGFKDYEFVREAFRLGARDYVLKSNMNFETLVSQLDLFLAEKRSVNQATPSHSPDSAHTRAKALEKLLFGVLPGEAGQIVQALGLRLQPRNLAVALLGIDDFRMLQDKFDPVILMNIAESSHQLINQKLSEFKVGECVPLSQERYALIVHFPEANSESALFQQRSMFFQHLQSAFMRMLNLSVTIGISSFRHDFGALHAQYQQALRFVDLKLLYGKGALITENEARQMEAATDVTIFGKEKKLLQAIERMDASAVKSELQSIMKDIVRSRPTGSSSVHGLYYELLYLVFIFMRDKGFVTDDAISQRNAFHALNRMDTIHEMNAYIEQLLLKQISEMKTYHDGTSSKIKKAIDYIRSHYAEEITLRSLSEHLQLSENHLSRMFTKETGESFIAYLTRTRIQKAKELLKQTDLPIGEISEAIGYANQEHFSRVFKKVEGQSPSAFRN
ncbi:helix-turn-helix domain-containing protein [Paenibacillus methanolicus]|uniref:YesN/AraC family two-component response regulator n=1 Tax=Paenibacillus methanolicus TaxID=582686 RepID=A0A5S5BY23_9BACL|nr:helix-turn-helix domain-containing protein [Paenibacillus methanolicus]TYP71092.1 YesN/AraC family two-component response regulator [Paenibacillus methanolicus]